MRRRQTLLGLANLVTMLSAMGCGGSSSSSAQPTPDSGTPEASPETSTGPLDAHPDSELDASGDATTNPKDASVDVADDVHADTPSDREPEDTSIADVTAEAAGCNAATCSEPGHACIGGKCVADCRPSSANPCAQGTVCDVGSEHAGQCVDPSVGCVVSGPSVDCPDGNGGSTVCGPGTSCNGKGSCYAALPCASVHCDTESCWGTSCSCSRPAPKCAPAPLGSLGEAGTLNDYAFTRGGDGGIFDLDFDQDCNAWGVTMISGPDYLRKLSPQGVVTTYTGVTNLNMGEVAAIQGTQGAWGGGLTDVALTYICCQSCGCKLAGPDGNPQGVAWLDAKTETLPMKIPTATFSSGLGPFANSLLDTGPYGLTWGLDRVLYAGNIDTNGDYHALDLETATKQVIATFPSRVHASAPFDRLRMLVVLEGGDVMLVPVLGGPGVPTKLLSLGQHATSMARDPWSGRVYAELSDRSIVSFRADGSGLAVFQTAPALGRIALAPDGFLYHLTVGWPTKAEIVRWALPATL